MEDSRFANEERIVVIINANSKDQEIDLTARYGELVSEYSTSTDVVTGVEFTDFSTISIKAKTALILEMK